uniref:Secreted protein n=1 Tax=Ditylenchus dipsaci TaxID=166011 RepID=A0A915EHK1_9BILA
MHSMLAICLIVLLLLTLLCLIGHGYSGLHFGLHNGYEKLVAPLLARLGSNQSISSASAAMNSVMTVCQGSKVSKTGEKEGNKEWIWLPRKQVVEYNASIGSRYSQRSTLGLSTDRAYSQESSSSSNNSGASNPLNKCDEEYPQGTKSTEKEVLKHLHLRQSVTMALRSAFSWLLTNKKRPSGCQCRQNE